MKGRHSLIHSDWEETLYRYITGIVQNKEQKMLAINGMPDHIHFLIGIKPGCCISDLVQEVKKSSNAFVRQNGFCVNFHWQEGFGAFSYGHSQLDNVIKYIGNQKLRHKRWTFKEEYLTLLEKFEVEYMQERLFEWVL